MVQWLNGELVSQALIPASDRGFSLGDGLFETMALAAGNVRHLDRHLARLRHGARVLGIPLVLSDGQLTGELGRLIAANRMTDGIVRLTLTRGSGARGLLPPLDPVPTMLMALTAPAPRLGAARVTLSTLTRRNEFSPICGIKTLNYLDLVLARQDAAQRGFDEAIVLNTQGKVAEATVSSIFAVLDGQLCTPPAHDGVLLGVARSLVLDHLGAVERSMTPADLLRAEQMVLTNALGARAVTQLDQNAIPAGEMVDKIQSLIEMS